MPVITGISHTAFSQSPVPVLPGQFFGTHVDCLAKKINNTKS